MHISGKVFAWLSVLGSLGAVALSAKMVQVRNSWIESANALTTEIEKNAAEIESQSDNLKSLLAALDRTTMGWDVYWFPFEMQPADPNQGTMTASFGSKFGLKEQQLVYAFQPNADGNGYTYVGPMRVVAVREQQSILAPTWRVLPGEGRQWNYGPGWRLRSMVPAARKARFSDLEVQLTLAKERVADEQQNYAIQERLVQQAQQHLDLRMKELLGDPANEPMRENLPQYLVDGLVTTLADTEEKRNAELVEVDRLRREIDNAHQKYLDLSRTNNQLVESLPQPQLPVTAKLTK